jgi:hypothetical protein
MTARMPRIEALFIGAFLLAACPVSVFVMVWWGMAALAMSGCVAVPDRAIAAVSLLALAAGAGVTALLVGRLVGAFYALPLPVLVGAYLFWSLVALAVLMGLPAGDVALGILAGIYVGRRLAHEGADATGAGSACRRAALFASAVTGALSAAMGCLAVGDQHTMQSLLAPAGLGALAETAARRAGIVAVAVLALVLLQYALTRVAARWAYGLGPIGGHA